jgi:hypothetical protein
MNVFITIFVVLVGYFGSSLANNRAKRFTTFGGLSTVGGHVGCVVSVSFDGKSI